MKQLFQTAITDIVTDATIASQEGLGQLRYENRHIYRFVQNVETAVDFVLGDLVVHELTTGVNFCNTVKRPVTNNLDVLAGVVQGNLSRLLYGWILIKGVGSVNLSGNTTGGLNVIAGDILKAVNAQKYAVLDVQGAGGSPPTFTRYIQALTAVPTTTTPAAALVNGYVNCL